MRRADLSRTWVAVAAVIAVSVPTSFAISRRTDDVPAVVIAEVMASNATTVVDEDGEATDWVELWNRSPSAVDLGGWELSDGSNEWNFPTLALAAGQRVVIFASGKSDTHRLHTSFKLSAEGEYLSLRDASGRLAAEFDPVPPVGFDVSYGLGSDGVVGVLRAPTPGAANTPVRLSAVAKPTLSRAGGYIDDVITVSASTETPNAQLWYTTDGSTPSADNGTLYVGPITIAGSTNLRVVGALEGMRDSFVASATFLVMDEVLNQSGVPFGWPSAPINEQRYIFGFDQEYIREHRQQVADALRAAPTLSITTDIENLTDPTIGLYSNSLHSGPAWDRPVSVELLDGDSGFAINGGLRVKGNYSRDPFNPKHSFRLTFGPTYEGALHYPVFGANGVQEFSSIELRTDQNNGWQRDNIRAGSSDRNTFIRDHFVRDSQAATGNPSTRSRWVHLFLNGQYWGLYMLRDDITANHAARLWGGSPDAYDVVQHSDNFGYETEDGDDEEWLNLWHAIEDGQLTDLEYARVDEATDLANLADFMLINICVGNTDGNPSRPLNEHRANNWQAVQGGGQPFRFFLDDAENTLGARDHNIFVDRTQDFPILEENEYWSASNFNPGWLHQVLLTRAEYRAIFQQRAATLLDDDGALATDMSVDRWRDLSDEIDSIIEAEVARWGHAGDEERGRPEWEAEIRWVETTWFPRRTEIVQTQLIADGLLDVDAV